MSTAWTREHWAKLSEDRKETAGLMATGSCGYPKLSKICEGVKHLCRQRDCAEVTTDYSCSRVGNPGVQSLSQFLQEKSRTSRKGPRQLTCTASIGYSEDTDGTEVGGFRPHPTQQVESSSESPNGATELIQKEVVW